MLVTTNLYLLLTFASEIQRRVDVMYTDERNILIINPLEQATGTLSLRIGH